MADNNAGNNTDIAGNEKNAAPNAAAEATTKELSRQKMRRIVKVGIRVAQVFFALGGLGLAIFAIVHSHGVNSSVMQIVASIVSLVLSSIALTTSESFQAKLNNHGISATEFVLFALWATQVNGAGAQPGNSTCTYKFLSGPVDIPWCTTEKLTAVNSMILVVLHYFALAIQFISVHIPVIQKAVTNEKKAEGLTVPHAFSYGMIFAADRKVPDPESPPEGPNLQVTKQQGPNLQATDQQETNQQGTNQQGTNQQGTIQQEITPPLTATTNSLGADEGECLLDTPPTLSNNMPYI